MKIAFDVDVLAKQMSISDVVYKVADWGYKYIEQSPHPRINPFYKHPLFSRECQKEYQTALNRPGVELSGDPNPPEICNGMWFKSMEELLPIFEREGIRCEIQSHPYDFCELNDETVDLVKSFRSDNLTYVYSTPHGFYYDQGKGDVRHMLEYAGDALSHVLFADTYNHLKDCRYILNPPTLNRMGCCDTTIHQHLAMGEGEVDFAGIFETLRKMDFANRTYKIGGESIACVSYFGFPEKMDKQAPAARERIERELLTK